MNRRFDAIVIGAGQAGPPMAARIAAAGKTVALIERKLIGGTCVNTGCTPTKAMVASAYAAHLARRAADFGVTAGPVGVDFAAVMARKNAIVANSRSHLEAWLSGLSHCTVIEGQARFVSPTALRVSDDVLEAERFFVNVGCRAEAPDFPGRDQVRTLNNTTLLELDALPERLVIVGGSYVGLEFAQIFRRFGSEVTVVEKANAPRLARGSRCLSRDPRNARGGGHQGPARIRNASDLSRAAATSRSASIACPASPRFSVRMYCSRSGAAPTPTISGSRPRA